MQLIFYAALSFCVLYLCAGQLSPAEPRVDKNLRALMAENRRLSKLIDDYQREPYIVIRHEDEDYRCYKLSKESL